PETARALTFQLAHDELVVAALLVERDRAEGAHLHAFVGIRRDALRVQAENDGAQLRARVAQAEIAVAGRVALPAGDLALDPERRDGALERLPGQYVYGGHRVRIGGRRLEVPALCPPGR